MMVVVVIPVEEKWLVNSITGDLSEPLCLKVNLPLFMS